MAALITETLLVKLKRFQPHKVRVYAGDEDYRDVAVPTRRKKWNTVIEAIEGRTWTRVVLLDKAGSELAYIDNTEPARDLEDLDTGKATKLRSESEWIVKLVITAQRDAMTFRDSEVTNLLRAQGDVVREMSQAMKDLSGIYAEQRRASTEAARIQAEAAAGGDGWKELLEAAPQLIQMLPMLRQLLLGNGGNEQPQPRPKNGA